MQEPPDGIFLGRVEQLKQLAGLLDEVIEGEGGLPRVALIYGLGGIGKSALLRRFLKQAFEAHGDRFKLIEVDWQEVRGKSEKLRVRPEEVEPGLVLQLIGESAVGKKSGFKSAQNKDGPS